MYRVPIFKIGQALTKEVSDGNAEAGELINSTTSEGIGNVVEFIVAYYQPGRFGVDRDDNNGRAHATVEDIIPADWADLVGEEFVGTPFSEHPDAEETYKVRVNNKEIPWGKGPKISTTHNFTGIALVEEADGALVPTPARFSLKRTDAPVARKWLDLRRSLGRSAMFWDIVFNLKTNKVDYNGRAAYNLSVTKGRPTTPEEQSRAYELYQFVKAGRVVDNSAGEGREQTAAPEAAGGLSV